MLENHERTFDLSADLGEAANGSQRAVEEQVWPLVHSANVACGGHAGDEASMGRVVTLAAALHVKLGAHPSYPDRENFGRRSMSMTPTALRASLLAQITSLMEIAAREDVRLHHVKPHGALYNDACHDRLLASIIVEATQAADPSLAIVASHSSQMSVAARAAGVSVIREAFADRRYMSDGSLTPRSKTGALLSIDETAAQVERLVKDRSVLSEDGRRVPVPFDTLCIHSDMEDSVTRLRRIRALLV